MSDNTLNEMPVQAYVASSIASENTLNYRTEMNAHDSELFEEQMEQEMNKFIAKETFDIVLRSSVPKEKTILNTVWTFKRKKTPDRKIYRHRSRLCVDGSRQK